MEIYERLGVRTYINAKGTITDYGGSLMDEDVLRVMEEASHNFIDIRELHKKAGEYIARILGVEACAIVSGASAGLAVSAAAAMAGKNVAHILQLPDTSGMKNEALILKCHRTEYDQSVRLAGARMIEVGSATHCCIEQLEDAVTEKTAMMIYSAESEKLRGSLPFRSIVSVMEKYGIPVIVDAAAELPPVDNITRYLDMGASLVVFSGGKEIRGPQASGLVVGKRELIEACDLNQCPFHSIGRSMKVDKETICGLVRAVELFAGKDYDKELSRWKAISTEIAEALAGPYVHTRVGYPQMPGTEPRIIARAYLSFAGFEGAEIQKRLYDEGLIVGADESEIIINPQCLACGEDKKVIEMVSKLTEELYHEQNCRKA